MEKIIAQENILNHIYIIRGQKVMLDFDLALLYGTENKLLKRQVRRNIDRFPLDFMFQLTEKEWKERVPNWHPFEKYRRISSLPFAFTEHGVAMLSSVLKSKQAIQVNLKIIRAFIELRNRAIIYEDLLRKLQQLENKTDNKLFEHENQIKSLFEAIQKMIIEDEDINDRKIGFDTGF